MDCIDAEGSGKDRGDHQYQDQPDEDESGIRQRIAETLDLGEITFGGRGIGVVFHQYGDAFEV